MSYKIDLTGQVFSRLTVLEYSEEYSTPSRTMWKCQCSCSEHTIRYIDGHSLKSGNTKSCGCLQKEAVKEKLIDLTGMTFGKWTVLKLDKNSKSRQPKWIVECSCEKHTIKSISGNILRRGESKSCGCLKSPDLTGLQFGRLTVIGRDFEKEQERKLLKKHARFYWKCSCSCGGYTSVMASNLIKINGTRSCGCLQREKTHEAKFDDLIGQKFGRLTVVEFDKKNSTTLCSRWICKCECGNELSVQAGNLKSGHTSSCGCLNSYIESVCKLYFDEIKTKYISQHTYDDCKYKQQLKFDFYLPDYNCCIEFDGLHHFEPATFGGRSIEQAEKDFEEIQIKDEIKNNYCQNNNIKLIRIPYWKFKDYKNILFDKLGIGGETCL